MAVATRVHLQFHPDWPAGAGAGTARDRPHGGTVLESLARDGVYRSQFTTGTSNGGLTAHPGGDRWRWESRLFGGRYDGGPAADRPVYGALDRHPRAGEGRHHGAAVRFGSAYLRLRPAVAARSTFCFPDSSFEPTTFGGPERLDELLALARSATGGDRDELDGYVEAHVHGPVRLADDVEAVVLDPCFADTPVSVAAASLGCALEFHPGFRLPVREVDDAYRGPAAAALARELGRQAGGVLTPDVVGAAAWSGVHDPQTLKRVWHLLARFGRVAG